MPIMTYDKLIFSLLTISCLALEKIFYMAFLFFVLLFSCILDTTSLIITILITWTLLYL